MKVCKSCETEKALEEFHKRTRALDGRQTRCKDCNRKQRTEYYRTAKGRESNSLAGLRSKDKNRRFLFDYLLEHPCVDCGESNPILLDFDHKDSSQKSFGLSAGLSKGRKTLLNEIAKCEVRCANCHRLRTAKQFDWRAVKWYDEYLAI